MLLLIACGLVMNGVMEDGVGSFSAGILIHKHNVITVLLMVLIVSGNLQAISDGVHKQPVIVLLGPTSQVANKTQII